MVSFLGLKCVQELRIPSYTHVNVWLTVATLRKHTPFGKIISFFIICWFLSAGTFSNRPVSVRYQLNNILAPVWKWINLVNNASGYLTLHNHILNLFGNPFDSLNRWKLNVQDFDRFRSLHDFWQGQLLLVEKYRQKNHPYFSVQTFSLLKRRNSIHLKQQGRNSDMQLEKKWKRSKVWKNLIIQKLLHDHSKHFSLIDKYYAEMKFVHLPKYPTKLQ